MKGFRSMPKSLDEMARGPVLVRPHFRNGGKVHDDAKADRKMIESAIKKHVNAPAPKGHKGLKKEY